MRTTITKSEYFVDPDIKDDQKKPKLKIKLVHVACIYMIHKDALPYRNLINTLRAKIRETVYSQFDLEKELEIEEFEWSGDYLGNSWSVLEDAVVPHLIGEADVMFTLADGRKLAITIAEKALSFKRIKTVLAPLEPSK